MAKPECSKENQKIYQTPDYCKKLKPKNSSNEDFEMLLEEENSLESNMVNFEVSHPGKLFKLIESLSDDSSKELEVKLNKYLCKESYSKFCFIINIDFVTLEATVNVIHERILLEPLKTTVTEKCLKNITEGAKVYKCGTHSDNTTLLDPTILNLIADIVPKGLNSAVLPILISREHKTNSGSSVKNFPVFFVILVKPGAHYDYIAKLCSETFNYCKPLLINTRSYEEQRRLKEECQNLLLVARKLFSRLGDVNDLLKEIMSEARRLTNAERCSLFLLEPDHMHLVAKVFDGVSPEDANTEVKIAADQGIAGHVAATGEILNIKDAYSHPLFYKGVDAITGFKTRNLLCFSIKDEDTIVGVAQLCNKIGGCFSYIDEQIAKAFSVYCGISIKHSLVYKKIQDAQARSKLSNELLMYHMQVNQQDVLNVLLCPGEHLVKGFDKFAFIPRRIVEHETCCFVITMMKDLKFLDTFKIKDDSLVRFILYIKKGYRDVPYHNWYHAFSVAHFAYLAIKNYKLVERKYFTQLEALAYFISCLCHDIDHRGTTNSFQQQSNSVLASLYSSEGSVMERHHLSQTICTLNVDGCNFLENLSKDEYIKCLDLIKDMILATDLASHYKIHSRQLAMAQEGYGGNPEHRFYLASLLMTCADLSDQTKEWPESKRTAQLIYAEFFAQGDMEKKMGKIPANMMDRETASIPDHQLEFLSQCCICIFRILNQIFPEAKVLVNAIKNNIICWESAKRIFTENCKGSTTSYDVLTSTELEEEVQKTLISLRE